MTDPARLTILASLDEADAAEVTSWIETTVWCHRPASPGRREAIMRSDFVTIVATARAGGADAAQAVVEDLLAAREAGWAGRFLGLAIVSVHPHAEHRPDLNRLLDDFGPLVLSTIPAPLTEDQRQVNAIYYEGLAARLADQIDETADRRAA